MTLLGQQSLNSYLWGSSLIALFGKYPSNFSISFTMSNTTIKADNYIGSLLFWLYIITALSLAGLITFDLWKLRSASCSNGKPHIKHDQLGKRRTKAQVFMALSVVSFSAVSLNMRYFLIDDYQSWAGKHGADLPRSRFGITRMEVGWDIWKWSPSSTLSKDFARDLCKYPRHYWGRAKA